MELRSIERAGTSSYRATVVDDGDRLVFLFRVEVHDGIQAVVWGEDFDEFMSVQTDFALRLLRAVLPFHLAGDVSGLGGAGPEGG